MGHKPQFGRLVAATLVLLAFAPAVGRGQDKPETPESPEPVRWKKLIKQSLYFLTIENGFRYATEEATRHPGLPFFKGYVDSVTNLHGWKDGNPFLDNYVGHPMQGAVSGYIWLQNDLRFRNVEFGKDPEYWKSRLRAALYAWVYSTQEEIGPFSEASIGNIQAKPPEQGLVDHVVTPMFGIGWLIGEDALDRYVIRRLERRSNSRVYRAIIRGTLNPTRSFANVLDGRLPWRRLADERERFLEPAARQRLANQRRRIVTPPPGVAPFELSLNTLVLNNGNRPCIGGGASVAIRMNSQLQLVGDWNGCMLRGLGAHHDGDFMTYMTGPRWTPPLKGRWHPYLQVLGGGNKITQQSSLPGRAVEDVDTHGFAFAAGAGLDYRLNEAVTFRLGGGEYTRAWVHSLPGFPAPNGLQFRAGVVLRMGTW